MNQTNSFADCRKFQMGGFDRPWRKLDDLFCRERLLRDKPANYGIADIERKCSLLDGEPSALFRCRTCRKAFGVFFIRKYCSSVISIFSLTYTG